MSSDNRHSERSTPMDLGERQGLAWKARLKKHRIGEFMHKSNRRRAFSF